jgi:hypothetical protein
MWGSETEGKGRGCMCGMYCVGKGKGEERGDVRLIGKRDSEGGRM